MVKTLAEVSGVLAAGYGWFRIFMLPKIKDILKIAAPLIEEVEKRAIDGKIDVSDRKQIVMEAVNLVLQQRKISLNPFEKYLVSKGVDKIASALPDFYVSKKIIDLLPKE